MKNGLWDVSINNDGPDLRFLTDFESKPVPEKYTAFLGSYLMRIYFSDEAYFCDIDDAHVQREILH